MIPACLDCGAEAVVLCPGSEGDTVTLLNWNKPLSRPVPDQTFCLPHARARGWPNFAAEKQREKRV